MFATPARMAGMPGFWRRSIEELRRQSIIAIKMEGLHTPTKPFPLINFSDADSIDRCKIMCDKDMGGFSKASLTHVPGRTHQPGQTQEASGKEGLVASVEEPAHALFKGSISTELPPNKPNIQRSGYAAWRTRDRGFSLFGKLMWDIDPYSYLSLLVKSDGRKYFINIQTDSIIPTDLHQHLLPTSKTGEWETVTVPFNQFVRTNYGQVVEPQKEMLRQKVKSIGIGLIDRVQGPFELRIADVYATNKPPKRPLGRGDTGFDLAEEEFEEEEQRSMFDEVEPKRKKGEPERILI